MVRMFLHDTNKWCLDKFAKAQKFKISQVYTISNDRCKGAAEHYIFCCRFSLTGMHRKW